MSAGTTSCAPVADRAGVPQAGRLFTFRLADRDFAVPAGSVREVARFERVTPVPLAPPRVAGVARHGNRLVPVIDLRDAVAASAGDRAGRPSLGVLVEQGGELHALLAERVEGPWDCPEDGPQRPTTAVPACLDACCGAIALRDERPVVILNLASLLANGAAGLGGDRTERNAPSGKDSEPMFQHEDWEYGR